MSKTFVFKRNRSEDVWKPVQHTPNTRRKSLPRERQLSPSRTPATSVYQSEFPLHASLAHAQSPSPSTRRMSRAESPKSDKRRPHRHRDLKRKFIFQLHDEIKKPMHTTTLEEISDMETITSICFNTLHSMMENKHQRKYLHHMNSSNSNSNTIAFDRTANNCSNFQLDKSFNNKWAEANQKKAKIAQDEMERAKKMSVAATTKIRKDERMVKTMTPSKTSHSAQGYSHGQSQSRSQSTNRFHQAGPSSMPALHINLSDTSHNKHNKSAVLKFNDEMSKFIAVDSQKLGDRGGKDDDKDQDRKQMTPMQALYCPWLRLSKEQVLVLEQLCKDEGIDPGIHAHYDVSNLDVFNEIREIRQSEQVEVMKMAEGRHTLAGKASKNVLSPGQHDRQGQSNKSSTTSSGTSNKGSRRNTKFRIEELEEDHEWK